MSDSPVLAMDACAHYPCEHFASLQRWFSAFLPAFRPALYSRSGLAQLRTEQTAVILLHAPAGSAFEFIAQHVQEVFTDIKCFAWSHRAPECARECVPEDVVEAVCAAIAPHSGAYKPFQVLPGVTGCAPCLCKAAAHTLLMAKSNATCLLQGETGTGKELFARAIHYMGERKHHPFVPVNCGAIPDALFENEMFGHLRGAYTDAGNTEAGLLAHAANGSLFLDEVDCLSPSAQVKLLRVLQEHEYRPVGSAKSVSTNVRIIAASNSDLRKRVEQRSFREDLFHRLNVLRLLIPPLRERPGDLALLARTFVRDFARRYNRPQPCISEAAYQAMERYDWPGNVRELEAVFERAVLLSSNSVITAEDLEIPDNFLPSAEMSSMQSAKNQAIMQFERSYLLKVLARCTGNISRAARIAGKERRSFQRLLRKHNLASADFRSI